MYLSSLSSMAPIQMIDIAVNFTGNTFHTFHRIDGMFKGIYNGKQHHVSDIAIVLSRAWIAGVDRIIVTGGSLEESKEALAIAETDEWPIFLLGLLLKELCLRFL